MRANLSLSVTPNRSRVLLLCLLTISPFSGSPTSSAEPLFKNSGFESGTLENWQSEGDAFSTQPTKGDNPAARGRESSFHDGEFWIGGFEARTQQHGSPGDIRGDQFTGTLTSREFTIEKPYICFLIGGGNQPDRLGVKLKCDGKEVLLATGHDSESMARCNADVRQFVGKPAQLIVFDSATGQWGHLNVDAFQASDQPLPDPAQQFAFHSNLRAEAYEAVKYDQPLRPQFHFTSKRNWINDPNGMVFDGKQYHLFFQHNPVDTEWGNMTWGHAVSTDMVCWRQLKHALMPYRVAGQSGTIFSGTAVVDHNNSLGVQQGDTPTLCAFFTFACQPRFYQAMAYSTDRGESWTYWNEGRPVVENQGFDHGERDPKVFWHEETQRWVMILWVQSNPGRVRFFTSKNLTDWTFASDLMRDWAFECMDLVFLPLGGDSAHTKAVLYDASFDYEVGRFDGKQFHTESGPFQLAGGGNFYAAQTFYNQPEGRSIQIGWMRGGPNPAAAYGLPYNGQMSFPCELTLHPHNSGARLNVWPIEEINRLAVETLGLDNRQLAAGTNLLEGVTGLDLVDLQIEFEPGDAEELRFELAGARLRYLCGERTLRVTAADDDGRPREITAIAEVAPRNGLVALRILVDRLSVETYVNDGEQFHACYRPPGAKDSEARIVAEGGDVMVRSVLLRKLRSAWPAAADGD